MVSVSDKTGVVDFARGLRSLGWEVIATDFGGLGWRSYQKRRARRTKTL